MVADATRIVRTCQGCQFYARQTHLPAQALQTIPITWLFAVWGLDLVGPLQKAPGGYTHLLVAVDKFSKWIEVRPLNSIRSAGWRLDPWGQDEDRQKLSRRGVLRMSRHGRPPIV